MTQPFKITEVGQPVQTRDGRKARVVDLNYIGDEKGQRVLVIITDVDGDENTESYTDDGSYYYDRTKSPYDLVPIPVEKTVYLNIYENVYDCAAHLSRKKADGGASSVRIACVKVTYKEGQFDD